MLTRSNETARSWAYVLMAGFTIAGVGSCDSSNATPGADAGLVDDGAVQRPVQKLTILHTNDIHSHFMGEGPEADYSPQTLQDDTTVGGLARLASAIKTARAAAATDGKPVLLLDAGDFMMGTLFETLALTDAPELGFMAGMGYDATTIGNHELDWTPKALAGILQTAATAGAIVPVLSSNLTFSPTDPGDDDLEAVATAGIIRTKLIKTVGQLKVGFFGLIGQDAYTVTPQAAPLIFEPIVTAATRMVNELRQQDKVDLVIALSHSGIDSTGAGEDNVLATMVPGIDVIISGHTHDKLMQPFKVGNTLIVTAGAYGQYLGNLQLSVTPAITPGDPANIVMDDYTLQNIDDTIQGDAETQQQVDDWIANVDTLLAPSQLSYKGVVARTDSDLALPTYAEAPIGNLVTDAYLKIGAMLQPTDPPVIAVEANGQLRAPLLKGSTGNIWFADLFRVTPLGIGPDQHPGFPLVTFYLSAQDIRSGLELDAAGPLLVADQYFLQVAGLKVQYDITLPRFGRVTSLSLVNDSGETSLDVTDTTHCYKVIATNYVAGLLGVVKTFTQGLLSVVAKDKTCLASVDPTQNFVDANPSTPAVDELKNWQAVLSYVSKSEKDTSGLPVVSAAYGAVQGRITSK